jgi:hypothetical protein
MKNMETFTVSTKVEAQPRIEKMLKRIERAFVRRGLLFAHSFGDLYTIKKYLFGRYRGKYIEVPYQDLTITMSELSDDWEVLFSTVPANPNDAHGSNAVHMMNPTIEITDTTSLLYPKFKDTCDHCTGAKRGRLKTITIRHKDTGEIKTVGNSCLFEYTAIDPALVESIMQIKASASGGYGGGARGNHDTENIADFAIKCALWVHNNKPYKSGLGKTIFYHRDIGEASETGRSFDPKVIGFCDMAGHPPRYTCLHPLQGVGVGTCDWSNAVDGVDSTSAQVDDVVIDLANEIIDYAHNLSGSNSFEFNCRQIWKSGFVSAKTASMAGGLLASFLKNRAKLHRQAVQAKKLESLENNRHLGTVGEKHDFGTVVVDFVRTIDGYYGQTTLTKFLTEEGDLLVWFRSGNKTDLTQGQKIKLSGKVKKHDSYNGRKQTVLTRGKIE